MKKRLVTSVLAGMLLCASVLGSGSTTVMAADDVTELVFWDMVWGDAGVYDVAAEKLVEQYNQENPDVHVTYQSVSWDNYYQTFLTAISSGTGPDIATAGSQTPMQFALMGEILPLTPIVEKWESENDPILNDFLPGILKTNYIDGEYIALPWHSDIRTMYYRTDYFEEAGIEELPVTWDELLDVMRELKEAKPDVYPFALAGELTVTNHLMNWLDVSNEVGAINAEGESDMASPKLVESMEFIATLMDEGLIPEGTIGYKDSDAQKMFYSGNAAMYLGGPVRGFFEDEELKGKVDILGGIQGPSAAQPHAIHYVDSIAAYNNKEPEKQDAIYDFVEWWLKNMTPLFTEGVCTKVPALSSIAENSYYETESAYLEKLINEKLVKDFVHATYPSEGFYPAFGMINGERYMGNVAQQVLSGRRDFEAILEEENINVQGALDVQNEATFSFE